MLTARESERERERERDREREKERERQRDREKRKFISAYVISFTGTLPLLWQHGHISGNGREWMVCYGTFFQLFYVYLSWGSKV